MCDNNYHTTHMIRSRRSRPSRTKQPRRQSNGSWVCPKCQCKPKTKPGFCQKCGSALVGVSTPSTNVAAVSTIAQKEVEVEAKATLALQQRLETMKREEEKKAADAKCKAELQLANKTAALQWSALPKLLRDHVAKKLVNGSSTSRYGTCFCGKKADGRCGCSGNSWKDRDCYACSDCSYCRWHLKDNNSDRYYAVLWQLACKQNMIKKQNAQHQFFPFLCCTQWMIVFLH